MDEDGVQVIGETSLGCPVCAARLSEGLMEGQELLYCTACKGVLVPMDKFWPLVEHLRALRDRPATYLPPRERTDVARGLACPVCSGTMGSHDYAGPGNVHIDTCEACSRIWLDRSELRRIVVAPDPQPLYSKYDVVGEFGQRD
jgi:Zn-finger nucleic acid-binding protein